MTKILLAEDDFEILDNIKTFLEDEGFEVVTSQNGHEAIHKLRTFVPDLIISDIMMPEMDGYELFSEVKKVFTLHSIPFIFLTAKADLHSIRGGMMLGADDYITKPFEFKDLLKAIKIRIDKNDSLNTKIENMKNQISMYLPHELRTPLVGILGFSNIIKSEIEELNKADIYDMVDKIELSGRRLLTIIEKFLKLADLEPFVHYEFKPEESSQRIDDAIFEEIIANHFNMKERKKYIQLHIQHEKLKIPFRHLQTILTELLENAVKFSSDKSTIEITGKKHEDTYSIEFLDQGIGMTKDQINKIDYFQQFNRNIREQQGNGIGLILVKKILNLVGGSLKIESEINKFTRVTVWLKLS